ncbi:MAG: hypothetical protein EOP49_45035 [Sphingobacteriales bacterium]|nr:MAG: hypothetical protein EOP49_45035 [Sphingobacteriales bacterium]
MLIVTAVLLWACTCRAQRIIFDRGHFDIVNQNAVVRSAAETTHLSYLDAVNKNLDKINLNLSAVNAAGNIIHRSLSRVNGVLKTGLHLQQTVALSAEVFSESESLIITASQDPVLLLFSEKLLVQLKTRSVNLLNEVYGFAVKEGENILMDFEKRDALLNKINLELRVIRALVYSVKRSVQLAKIRGVMRSVNPFASFINTDKRMAEAVLMKYKNLKN